MNIKAPMGRLMDRLTGHPDLTRGIIFEKPDRELPPLPGDFWWGSATASEQVESGLRNDWFLWQVKNHRLGKEPGSVLSDDGPRFAYIDEVTGKPAGTFRAYLAAAKAMGHTAFRFSLEWSRIQPSKDGPYDPQALQLYHAILDECEKNGLRPLVTLQHFDFPIWLHDITKPDNQQGGWAPGNYPPGKAPVIEELAKFAGDMAREFGDQVHEWVTINEPMITNLYTYLTPDGPGPTQGFKFDSMWKAAINMVYTHARAYDAIKAARPDAKVGIAQHYRVIEPLDPNSSADQAAAAQWGRYFNTMFLDAVTSGNADFDLDGKFEGPFEGQGIAGLKDRLDFVGINYYSREKVKALPFALGGRNLKFKGVPITALPFIGRFFQTLPVTDSGWEIYPEGLYLALKDVDARYKLPIIVTENGIDDRSHPDVRRPAFQNAHITQIQRAVAEGVPVQGFLVWSLMDNFEWTKGFKPQFGLTRPHPDETFSPTLGSQNFTEAIQNHGVTPDMVVQYGEYASGART